MRLQLVMSLLAMSLGDRFCVSGKGRLVGVPEECKHCMAMSGIGFREVLVGNGWVISLLLTVHDLSLENHPLTL